MFFGKEYKLWRGEKYLGIGTWRKDDNVGDSFQRDGFDKELGYVIIEVIIADRWELIIKIKNEN